MELFRPRIQRIVGSRGLSPFIRSVDIPNYRGQKVRTAGIRVTGKEVSTKKQEPMIFVSFEDELAIYETVFFPSSFTRFYPLLDDGWVFLVFGRVEDDSEALSVSAEKLLTISRKKAEETDARGEGTAPMVPERPPVPTWGRDHAQVVPARSARESM